MILESVVEEERTRKLKIYIESHNNNNGICTPLKRKVGKGKRNS